MHDAHLVEHGGAVVCDDRLAFTCLDLCCFSVMLLSVRVLLTILSIPLGPKDYYMIKISIRLRIALRVWRWDIPSEWHLPQLHTMY